ncbi:uncharacterized protein LOC135393557 [Ornithodoros turicata]|uniref:uncharacterized protein LOC135393557 n=1 Tax=Ornithodoros turicata TaxID=34597 RepID=UPI003138CDBC
MSYSAVAFVVLQVVLTSTYSAGIDAEVTDAFGTTPTDVDVDSSTMNATASELSTLVSATATADVETQTTDGVESSATSKSTSTVEVSASTSTQPTETTTSVKGYRRLSVNPKRQPVLSPQFLSKVVMDIFGTVQALSVDIRRLSDDVTNWKAEAFQRLDRLEMETKERLDVSEALIRGHVNHTGDISNNMIADLKVDVLERLWKLEEVVSNGTEALSRDVRALKLSQEEMAMQGINGIDSVTGSLENLRRFVKEGEDNTTERLDLIEARLQGQTILQGDFQKEVSEWLNQTKESISGQIGGLVRQVSSVSQQQKDWRNQSIEMHDTVTSVADRLRDFHASFVESEKISAESFALVKAQAQEHSERLKNLEVDIAEWLNRTEDVILGRVSALTQDVLTGRHEFLTKLDGLQSVAVGLKDVKTSLTELQLNATERYDGIEALVQEHNGRLVDIKTDVMGGLDRIKDCIPKDLAQSTNNITLMLDNIEESLKPLPTVEKYTREIKNMVQQIKPRAFRPRG